MAEIGNTNRSSLLVKSMMRKTRTFFSRQISKFIVAVIFAILTAFLFQGCNTEVEKIKPFTSPENLPVLSAVDFETTYIDSFKIQFYMKAPVLERYVVEGQPYLEFPKGILLVKYDSQQKVISRITSDYARQYEKEKKWEARNNVVAVNYQGDTLKTEYLVWEEKSKRIYSDKFVKVITKDRIITGTGFASDQNLQNWVIKDIKGTIYMDMNQKQAAEQPPVEPPKAEDKRTLKFEN
jgi:LPS export ABC transporter protein LptC